MIQLEIGLGVVEQYWLFTVPQFALDTRTFHEFLSLNYSRVI